MFKLLEAESDDEDNPEVETALVAELATKLCGLKSKRIEHCATEREMKKKPYSRRSRMKEKSK